MRLAKQPSYGTGVKLREEVTFDTIGGVEAVTWEEATDRFRSWYDEQRDTKVVVENGLGERRAFRTPSRFSPEYREMLYAKAQALERGLRDRWGKLLHTAMVTLTASSTDAQDRPRPPAEHLGDLLASWEAVRRSLARVLDGREWEYLAILEPHESGYVHIHLGVFVKGPVVAEQFRPVIEAHLRNCPTASEAAHQLEESEGEPAVKVRRASHPSRNDGVENLGAYLAAYMAGEYGTEATEMPRHVQRFYAVMWATGRQWFRPSNGAQELMQPPGETEPERVGPETEWSVVGIAPEGDPSDTIEVTPGEGGRVEYRRVRGGGSILGTGRPPPEPPPEGAD